MMRVALALGLAGWVLVSGCATPSQQEAREAALERWQVARAGVKARLAADQFAAGRLEAAAVELDEARTLDPENDRFKLMHARLLVSDGEPHRALEVLAALELTGSRAAEADYLRGIVHQQLQGWSAAANAYLAAFARQPREVAYFAAALQALLQTGDVGAVEALLAEAEATIGWTAAYQAGRAEWLEQQGRWRAAALAWRQAGEVDRDPALLERYAYALYRSGAADAAEKLEQVITNDGVMPAPALRLALADCLLQHGDWSAAAAQLEQIDAVAERNADALVLSARLWAARGAFARALRLAEQAYEIRSNDIYTAELVATLAFRVGASERAREVAQLILERFDHESPIARHLLAQ